MRFGIMRMVYNCLTNNKNWETIGKHNICELFLKID